MPDEPVTVETAHWWQYASDDLATAEVLHAAHTVPSRHVCLHAQQAAEKALKSLFVYQQLPVPKVHDLGYLQRRLPNNSRVYALPERELDALAHWAVESRYPGEDTAANFHDAETAIATARRVLDAVEADLVAAGFIHP
ncbi:MAG TPA: HEPN domain-containing protein [Armatimonadota bacterium]|jgi:HEPN domain-containing protein